MAKQRFRDIKQGKVTKGTGKHPEKKVHPPYAPIILKVKAFITDAFMLLMPIMYVVFYLVMDGREGFAQEKLMGWIYILAPLVIIQTLFMAKSGQTPGYRAYNITLIDENTGAKPSWYLILFRNMAAILSFFTIIGWLIMFFRRDKKNLHDLLSATAVIYKK